MKAPLVTVICLCYNQAKFVKAAMASVLAQTYRQVQLIVVDDASKDESSTVIREAIKDHPEIIFLELFENLGNCRAFNKGLALASGEFVIDLAADDLLMPERIEKGVNSFSSRDSDYGVNFSDANLVTEHGEFISRHSDRFPHATIPEGDVYKELISRYFICSPSMMIRRSVLNELGGYDESLAYEDFDFWIRSSRNHKYCYTPECLVTRRIVTSSMARKQYRFKSLQMESTFRVCQKIAALNRTDGERAAFRKRVRYEMRCAIQIGEISLAGKYLRMLMQ